MAGLDLPARRQSRKKTRLTPPLVWSGAAHLTILALLTLGVYHRTTTEPLPPPGVAMVFESGSTQGPRLPNPTREANPEPRPAAAPSALAPSPPPEAAAAPALPVPPVPPAPPEEAAPQPPSPAQASQPPPEQANAAPPSSATALAESPLAEAIPPPAAPKTPTPSAQKPVEQAMVMPPPNARPLTPTPPEAAPRANAPQAQTARKGSAYAPMRLFANSLPSLNKFALGPAALGPTSITPFAKISAKELGADWRNELADWIEQHKYYPEDAARRGEQGINEVRVVVNRDGHVESVEIERQSGFQRLDNAAVGLFRDADLPPFPVGTEEERVTIDLTIHYVIYHN